ncbi:MAG: hypothetical protein S4CHLAM2_00920 [Chlamydiales bacterium]|nr:hypothetical protein [Chlamydiales bacterium]
MKRLLEKDPDVLGSLSPNWRHISLEELAGYLSEKLRVKGIETILFGGACVTIYSQNRYQSYDLDFITYKEMSLVSKAFKEIGFKINGRYFFRDDCPWFVEFVSPPVAVGNEPIEKFVHWKTEFGTIRMLSPVDSIKDRLASYFHWDDRQGLEQAIEICMERAVDLKNIEAWSQNEGHLEKYQIFYQRLQKIN